MNPLVSPVHADLGGLLPLVIDADDDDLIVSDDRLLASRAQATGLQVRYREHPGLAHGLHTLVGVTRAANQALDDFARALMLYRFPSSYSV